MSWHYQLMRHKVQHPCEGDGEHYYAMHEYYEMEDGPAWTENPVQVTGANMEDLKKSLLLMLQDIEKHGVKDYK